MSTVLVCGSRHWTDSSMLFAVLSNLPDGTHIIEGAAPGGDTMAGEFARKMGWPLTVIYADWAKYGRAAGPIRNRQMLDLHPDLVIAFHEDLAGSKGTRDCVEEAKRRGIEVVHVDATGASRIV